MEERSAFDADPEADQHTTDEDDEPGERERLSAGRTTVLASRETGSGYGKVPELRLETMTRGEHVNAMMHRWIQQREALKMSDTRRSEVRDNNKER